MVPPLRILDVTKRRLGRLIVDITFWMRIIMVYATRRFEFSAAHRYWRDDWSKEQNERVFGKCTSPYGHGHNYTLDVTVKGRPDPITGMIMNMVELKALVGAVLEAFDHKHLNEDTPFFKQR